MKIPIAEHFHSIQGEGFWVGTPMHFIRLAGCSVGKLQSLATDPPLLLPTGNQAWLCHTWDRRPFWCDTDFNKSQEVELEELLDTTWEHHICITGGEPLIHKEKLRALIDEAIGCRFQLHIETSGTIPIFWKPEHLLSWNNPWVTVSPKLGCLEWVIQEADEIKLLVSKEFNLTEEMIHSIRYQRVFLSPINDVGSDNWRSINNLELCYKLLREHPHWRLSVQLHKYLGVR